MSTLSNPSDMVEKLLAWADKALPNTDEATDYLNEDGWADIGEIVDAFRSALKPSSDPTPSVAGFVMVPVEPTDAMRQAAFDVIEVNVPKRDSRYANGTEARDAVYRAMIAAAPDARQCTCHPDDRPEICQHRYAASECQAAAPASPIPPAGDEDADLLADAEGWYSETQLAEIAENAWIEISHLARTDDRQAVIDVLRQEFARLATPDPKAGELLAALERIEGGHVEGAINLIIAGDWQGFVEKLQAIARAAIAKVQS